MFSRLIHIVACDNILFLFILSKNFIFNKNLLNYFNIFIYFILFIYIIRKYHFIYFSDLCCCMGFTLVAVLGHLIVVASLGAEHGF